MENSSGSALLVFDAPIPSTFCSRWTSFLNSSDVGPNQSVATMSIAALSLFVSEKAGLRKATER
jgi:hypothetical protein